MIFRFVAVTVVLCVFLAQKHYCCHFVQFLLSLFVQESGREGLEVIYDKFHFFAGFYAFFRFFAFHLLESVFMWLAFCQTLFSRRVLQRG